MFIEVIRNKQNHRRVHPTETINRGATIVFSLVIVAISFPVFALQESPTATQYALPFGNNPYFPSRTQAAFNGFLNPSDFPSAAYSGNCHQDPHKQWRQSAHATSFRPPFHNANVQILIAETAI